MVMLVSSDGGQAPDELELELLLELELPMQFMIRWISRPAASYVKHVTFAAGSVVVCTLPALSKIVEVTSTTSERAGIVAERASAAPPFVP